MLEYLLMIAEIPAIYRTVAQAATHEIGNPEWEEHRSLTLRFLETAILHTSGRDRLLIVGHGTGQRQFPSAFTEFAEIYINDINPEVIADAFSVYQMHGVPSPCLRAVPVDITGIVEEIQSLATELTSQTPTQQITDYLSCISEEPRAVTLSIPPADLTISRMVLTQTWALARLYLHDTFKERLLGEQFNQIKEVLANVMFDRLPRSMFQDHLTLLKRHTKPEGTIALITETTGETRLGTHHILPQQAESTLEYLATNSCHRFGNATPKHWTWRFEPNLRYHITAMLLDPQAIPTDLESSDHPENLYS